MRTKFFWTGIVLMAGGIYMAGCQQSSTPAAQVSPEQHNAELAAPYSPGTGVSGNSFERRPRFYTGPQDNPSPSSQPSAR